MPADTEDTLLPFSLPSIGKKKVTAAFDGGQVSSDGGALLLAGADKRLGLIDRLAGIIPDHRDPAPITHTMADILRARVLAIACGYPDANDLDHLRRDPAFKLACGRLPDSGDDLASQPTMSRWENAPDLRSLVRIAEKIWSGRRDSNPRPQPWQGCALPLSYARSPSVTRLIGGFGLDCKPLNATLQCLPAGRGAPLASWSAQHAGPACFGGPTPHL